MGVPIESLPIGLLSVLALVTAMGLAALVVYTLDGRRHLGTTLRRRFVLGVPWGTVLVVLFVVAVYLFVQGAWGRLTEPVVVGFRAWSYSYLVGMVTAPFGHSGLGHITGNLLGTVVFAPIAEYAWSHYPTERGSRSFGSPGSNPYVRIGTFVVAVLLVGLATSFLIPGPLIGFSGVVFAFAGFAVVTKPVLAVFAVLGSRVVDLLYYTSLNPVVSVRARRQFVEPWWADVAVQAHVLGLLVGILLATVLVVRRRDVSRGRYVGFALVVFAVSESLYIVYWQFGADRFVMYRAAGLAFVFLLTAAAVYGVSATDRNLFDRTRLNGRQIAVGALLAVVLAIGLAAVPYNLVDVGPADSDGIEIRDYTVTYEEDVRNGYLGAVTLPVVGDRLTGSVNASGVIVQSDRRDAWMEELSTGQLALSGRGTVTVGGLGWRATVIANRSTWNAVDAGDTYKIYLRRPGDPPKLSFRDDPVRLAPRIAGVNLSIEPVPGRYVVNATRNGSIVDRASMPAVNETTGIAGLTLVREENDLFAVTDDTRVRVARYQTGREQA
jgi:membrane associated rhomboid family serine protease